MTCNEKTEQEKLKQRVWENGKEKSFKLPRRDTYGGKPQMESSHNENCKLYCKCYIVQANKMLKRQCQVTIRNYYTVGSCTRTSHSTD